MRDFENEEGEDDFQYGYEFHIRDKHKPYHKRKSTLSKQAQIFREAFFLIFTKKKKFPKTIIWEIHKLIQEPLNLKNINRDIIRDNDKYFENFVNESTNIIHYLQNNKEQIRSLVPQLKKYE